MPRGGFLYQCGINTQLQRTAYIASVNAYEEKNLKEMADKFYLGMKYTYPVTLYCWYGIKQYVDGQYLLDLIIKFKIFEVILFNLGYMWTDFVMLALGRPG